MNRPNWSSIQIDSNVAPMVVLLLRRYVDRIKPSKLALADLFWKSLIGTNIVKSEGSDALNNSD